MKTHNDKLKEAFKRVYIGRQVTPKLPESKPARSFTELFKAAIRRAMRSVNSES